MGPKRSTPLDDPPSASSDDEETEDEQEQQQKITHKTNQESESESESEDDDEEEEESEEEAINPVKKPQIENPKIENPSSKTQESSSEEELESESESESEEEQQVEEIATPVKIPIEKSKTLNPNSSLISEPESESDFRSPTASGFAIQPSKKITVLETPEKTPNSKRPIESDTKSKKKIKLSNGDIDDEKKSVIKRVWTEEDELLLLQGFIDYESEKGRSPLSDIDGFYRFLMDSLPGNASKSQVYEKVRRMKKKYQVNSAKGDDPAFSKPHENKIFELSKKIWGIGKIESGVMSKTKTKTTKIEAKVEDKVDKKRVESVDFETSYPHWNAGLKLESSSLSFPEGVVGFIKKNLGSIGGEKAKEMDEKWKAHFESESLLCVRRVVLLGKVGELVESSLGN